MGVMVHFILNQDQTNFFCNIYQNLPTGFESTGFKKHGSEQSLDLLSLMMYIGVGI